MFVPTAPNKQGLIHSTNSGVISPCIKLIKWVHILLVHNVLEYSIFPNENLPFQMVYKCIKQTCNETFQDLDEFLEHIKIHEDDMTYRCHICNEEFESLDDLGKHQYSHSLNTTTGEIDKRRRTSW